MATARHAAVAMTYNDKSASQMAQYLDSIRYTDVASGSSDSISVELNDPDRRWIGGWFPQKGDILKPVIQLWNWSRDSSLEIIRCGTFVIDDFSFKGNPIHLSLRGLAIPSMSSFKTTGRTHTYENTTIREIGEVVAGRAGLTLYYDPDAPEIAIESVAQDNQADCTFFNNLVVKFGLALKIYNDRLVVFSEAAYEAKDPVAVLSESDFEPGWQWNTTLEGTYTGVRYQYTHAEKDETFTVEIGGGDRILTCNDEANNQTEATAIALAKLNSANKSATTMKITLKAAKRITATSCVEIVGLGRLSGKYYVDEVSTSVGSGTKMDLTLRMVETRFSKPAAIASSVEEEQTIASAKQYAVGDRVRVTQGAKTYTGGSLASFVYTTVYTVIQVGGKNLPDDRIVIGIDGAVTAAVRAADLYPA